MRESSRKLIYWSPRLLCLAFGVFLSLFALDVFEENAGIWPTTAALLMHLIPTGVVLAGLALSWRREWVGAILFTALGVLYVALFAGRFHWSAYLAISGPLVLVGALFLIGWRKRAVLRPGP